jgi:DNA modification methylase
VNGWGEASKTYLYIYLNNQLTMKQIEVHNPSQLPCIDYHNLSILQGDLKTLSEENKAKLCKSILKHGYFVPAFVWRSGEDMWILDATQRYYALEELERQGYKIPPIPYILIEANDKKDAAEKLLQITSRYGEVDPETSFLTDFDLNIDELDIGIPELDLEFEEASTEIEEDEVPEEPVTQVGNLWLCGSHRVLCGDATKAEDVERLMCGKKADMCFCDPPYGINIIKGNNEKDYGVSKQKQYENLSWDISIPKEAFKTFFEVSKDQIFWGANYYWDCFHSTRCYIIWDKRGDLPKVPFADTEFAWTSFDKMSKKYTFIHHGFINTEKEERVHPTQKPLKIYTDILNDFSKKGNIIVDFFLGSGTTLIAAEQLNRICYGMEIEPRYVDVILERYAKFTGNDPIREDGVKRSDINKNKEV